MSNRWLRDAMRDSSWSWINAHQRFPLILIQELGYRVSFGAEVGVAFGSMSMALLQQLPGLSLVGVDPYVPYDEQDAMSMSAARMEELYLFAEERVNTAYPGRYRLVRKPSVEASSRIPDGWLDFVFLDGDHRQDAVTADIKAWLPKVKKGGLICGHDFTPGWPGVVQAVKEAADTLVGFTQLKVDPKSMCWLASHG